MKFRTIGLVTILLIGVILFSGCANKKMLKKGDETNAPSQNGEGTVPEKTDTTTPEKPVEDVGKMNDDVWVEITAQNQYGLATNPTKFMTMGGVDRVIKDHGVTPEQYNAYTDKITAEPNHYMDLVQRVSNRVNELTKK